MWMPARSEVSLGDLLRLEEEDGVVTAGWLAEADEVDTDKDG